MLQNEIRIIDNLLPRYGLAKTWASLLYANVKTRGEKCRYILSDEFFRDADMFCPDVLGGLSIGEISILYEYSLAFVDRDKRKEEGQYFTPDDVARLMCERADLFPAGVWLDPCSGVGNLSYWLIKRQNNSEEFLEKNMYLVDRDALALFIARVLLTLEFQNKRSDLFNRIKDRFIVTDFLESEYLPKYDYAILNPPYVSTDRDMRFESYKTRNTYAYFIEKVIKNTRGFISISPQSFTNAPSFEAFREMLIKKFNKLFIYCFDNVPANVFKGIKFGSKNTNKANSTRAGIIVALMAKGAPKEHRITPLMRWRATERAWLFANVDSFLTKVELSARIFPKINKELSGLYRELVKSKLTLADIAGANGSRYALQVPSTPRYFISALKIPVERTSFRTLYFDNKEDFELAYLILNSSYMYWWWRVNDGGMTISEQTLMSLPIPERVKIDPALIRSLERSESVCKVFKKNAGKMNANVKHDFSLIQTINNFLFPEFADGFRRLHGNSIVSTI